MSTSNMVKPTDYNKKTNQRFHPYRRSHGQRGGLSLPPQNRSLNENTTSRNIEFQSLLEVGPGSSSGRYFQHGNSRYSRPIFHKLLARFEEDASSSYTDSTSDEEEVPKNGAANANVDVNANKLGDAGNGNEKEQKEGEEKPQEADRRSPGGDADDEVTTDSSNDREEKGKSDNA